MKNKQILTIPNVLSFIRLAFIPFIIWTYSVKRVILSSILVVVSGITDVVDGFIARRFNMVSALGKALDPIADKLTILTLLIAICFEKPIILPLLIIFIVKEFLMGIEGLIIIKCTGTTYSSKWYGKISTVLMYLTLLTFILYKNITKNLEFALIILNLIIVILSFILYTISNFKNTKNINKENT